MSRPQGAPKTSAFARPAHLLPPAPMPTGAAGGWQQQTRRLDRHPSIRRQHSCPLQSVRRHGRRCRRQLPPLVPPSPSPGHSRRRRLCTAPPCSAGEGANGETSGRAEACGGRTVAAAAAAAPLKHSPAHHCAACSPHSEHTNSCLALEELLAARATTRQRGWALGAVRRLQAAAANSRAAMLAGESSGAAWRAPLAASPCRERCTRRLMAAAARI